uniref:Uncharacterized protein n=1 Tax=Glossina palpalis gambiensis TaxID=67801 RepID=A0A1B0BG90_9MUSC
MAPFKKKKTRRGDGIMQLCTRLQNLQVFKLHIGYELHNDYELIDDLNYKIMQEPKEVFEPYVRLNTAFAIGNYIDEELNCRRCLRDLTEDRAKFFEEVMGQKIPKGPINNIIATIKHINPVLPKEEVITAFEQAAQLFYSAVERKMLEKNIAECTPATVVEQIAFFKTTGSGAAWFIEKICWDFFCSKSQLTRTCLISKVDKVQQNIEEMDKSCSKCSKAKVMQVSKGVGPEGRHAPTAVTWKTAFFYYVKLIASRATMVECSKTFESTWYLKTATPILR